MKIAKTFFSGNAPASLGLVGAIGRQLQFAEGSLQVGELEARLLVPGFAENESAFRASLKAAIGIGLLSADGDVSKHATVVSLDSGAAASFESETLPGEFLTFLASHAARALESNGEVPDLAVALAWLFRANPARPFSSWSAEGPHDPEGAVEESGLGEVIQGATQWNSFRRWAHSLGCANLIQVGVGTYLEPDLSQCFGTVLDRIDPAVNGRGFVAALSELVPFTSSGSIGKALVQQYPNVPELHGDLSSAESYALVRLEVSGLLKLQLSADTAPDSRVLLATEPTGSRVFSDVEVLTRA